MRKILAVIAAAGICLAIGVNSANAIPLTNKKAVGWFDPNAPIGGAYWFNERVGVQAGVGFFKVKSGGVSSKTDIVITGAVPIRLAGPESCHFLFRPGISYEKNPAFDTEGAVDNILSIRGDLVAEYFLSHHFSIVGGTGIEYRSINPTGSGESSTDFRARPLSLSSVGMYYYFGPDGK